MDEQNILDRVDEIRKKLKEKLMSDISDSLDNCIKDMLDLFPLTSQPTESIKEDKLNETIDVVSVESEEVKEELQIQYHEPPPNAPEDGYYHILIMGEIDRSNPNFPTEQKLAELKAVVHEAEWSEDFTYDFEDHYFHQLYTHEKNTENLSEEDTIKFNKEYNRMMRSDAMMWTLKDFKQ